MAVCPFVPSARRSSPTKLQPNVTEVKLNCHWSARVPSVSFDVHDDDFTQYRGGDFETFHYLPLVVQYNSYLHVTDRALGLVGRFSPWHIMHVRENNMSMEY